MGQIDFIARVLTGVVTFGFLIAGIFGILDYFIVKFLLFALFIILAVYMLYVLFKNENHPKLKK